MRKLFLLFTVINSCTLAQGLKISITELDNRNFKTDKRWRGADGAATVQLDTDKILWLFSDTFIDQDGTGKRSNSKSMIRNSIAIQNGDHITSPLTFYTGGTTKKPDDFFKLPGKNWFWTGHSVMVNHKLIVFLMEETQTNTGLGFEAVGWHIVIVDNPHEDPSQWRKKFFKGPATFGVIVGSSAVLQDDKYVYAFGVKEPASHETYLLRIEKEKLINGNLSNMEWWTKNSWTSDLHEEPKESSLFHGQTEFSVHYDRGLKKYVQVQTYGFGKASIGYRLADQLYGPWTEPVLFYTPELTNEKEFVYTANTHPEFSSTGMIITYNVNNFDFSRLIQDEEIYFPKIILVDWRK